MAQREKVQLRLLYQTIGGCGFAKNKSILQSHGTFLCFLDADDVMAPNRLEELYEAGLQNGNAIIGSNFQRCKGSTMISEFLQDSESGNNEIYRLVHTSYK
jgi:glycosyltransferase involved in cell wall biosynthesis